MSPLLVISILTVYFLVLIIISYVTSKGADTNTFFTGNRQSPWYLVAFGMIGASLSGVTFISVPGNVGKIGFGYFQIVLGYLVGYWVIIGVLMPLYYRLNLIRSLVLQNRSILLFNITNNWLFSSIVFSSYRITTLFV
jgi:Na+/proline symporter